jgi:hypothetical protein
MHPGVGVNHAAHLADLEGERGLFERRLHLPRSPLAKAATCEHPRQQPMKIGKQAGKKETREYRSGSYRPQSERSNDF